MSADGATGGIETVVSRLFGDGSRFEWRGAPIEPVVGEDLFRTVVERDDLEYEAQIYLGLGALGGDFWEQDVRVLLRVGALRHVSLQRVEAGGYVKEWDAAYVVSGRAPYALSDYPTVAAALRGDKAHAFEVLTDLADALSILHGQGILHRNLWPGAIRFEAGVNHLCISRFEMSALIHNVLRGAPDDRTTQARTIHLAQGVESLLHTAPERLDEFLVDRTSRYLESGAADVFSLGVLAARWFLGPESDADLRIDDPAEDLAALRAQIRDRHDALRARVREEGRVGALPRPLADLLGEMLDEAPPRRTVFEVLEALVKHRDTILGTWEDIPERPHLVLFMPAKAHDTIYQWGHLHHDPADLAGPGPQELRELIEKDLKRGALAYSPRGATDFVGKGDPDSLARTTTVLLGEKFAWFAHEYREQDPVTRQLGEAQEDALLIMFVLEHERIRGLRDLAGKRSLPVVEVARSDQGEQRLRKERSGRPSWRPLVDSTREGKAVPEFMQDWLDGFGWLLKLRWAELKVGTFPFVTEDQAGRSALIGEDSAQRAGLLAKDDVASELAASLGYPSMGDYLDRHSDSDDFDEGSGRVTYWPGDSQSRRGTGSVRHADPTRLRLTRDDGSLAIPATGMVRASGHDGSVTSIRRQEDALAELALFPGLLDQFHHPTTIRLLGREFVRVGEGLRGRTSRRTVREMLTSEPFYALQGPPGSGKTTVVAHAVVAYLRARPGARILISAQSNAALDNLAVRVLDMLDDAKVDHLSLRVATSDLAKDAPDRVKDRLLDEAATVLVKSLRAHAESRLDVVAPELRHVMADWKRDVEDLGAEMRSRLQHGANIVFATCEGSAPRVLGHNTRLPAFDWAIVEEAAKAWPVELAIPLVRATRWTLIGDHKQLPAHRREEIEGFLARCATSERQSLLSLRGRVDSVRSGFDLFGGLFKTTDPDAPVGMLTRQFRMREPIAEVISRAFYDGKLETDPSAEARTHDLTSPGFLRHQPLVWLDTTGWIDQDEEQWSNPEEAALVARLVSQMHPQISQASGWQGRRLAVLTGYHAQRRLLEDRNVPEVHTIHSFQGSEAEVVVASLVRTRAGASPQGRIGHLSKPEVANVLLSRARRLLVIVGRFDHFRDSGSPEWASICETVEELGRVVSWRDSGLVEP